MKQHSKFWFTTVVAISLVACGGGGGTGSSPGSASLTGTVAVGAPLPEATVTLKDAAGKTLTRTADANGVYTFPNVSGLTAPLMLQATGTAGGTAYTLHSLLDKAPETGVNGVINVTPATEAITAQATDAIPADVFADPAKIKTIDPVKLADTKARLNTALADVLVALGKDTNVDLVTTPFKADNTGLDKLLDLVSISNQDSSQGLVGRRVIRVTDKTTQVTRTVLPNSKLIDIQSIPAPSQATLALDTATIRSLIAQFNALTASTDSINSNEMKDLFDPDFMHDGLSRDDQIADLATTKVGITLADYVLNGCDGTTKICKGQATAKFKNGSTQMFSMPMKLGTDNKWRAYGEQNPFKFDIKPAAVIENKILGGATRSSQLQTGFNFWFYGTKGSSSTRVYKSAKLYVSLDAGATWTLSASLKENSACANWLSLDTSAFCDNFVSTSDGKTISEQNAAQTAGNKWFKIVAYPNADFSGVAVEYKTRSTFVLFDEASATTSINESGLNIITSDLLTSISPSSRVTKSVSFSGNPSYVSIETSNAATYRGLSGSAAWDDPKLIQTLQGKASMNAAFDQCGTSETCVRTYSACATIVGVKLGGYDSQGRAVWKQWRPEAMITTLEACYLPEDDPSKKISLMPSIPIISQPIGHPTELNIRVEVTAHPAQN